MIISEITNKTSKQLMKFSRIFANYIVQSELHVSILYKMCELWPNSSCPLVTSSASLDGLMGIGIIVLTSLVLIREYSGRTRSIP